VIHIAGGEVIKYATGHGASDQEGHKGAGY